MLEFPFCHNFADEEGGRVAELPVLTAGSPFPAGLSQIRNTGNDLVNDDGGFSEQSKEFNVYFLFILTSDAWLGQIHPTVLKK